MKLLVRIGAVVFVAVAITVSVIEMREAPKPGVEEAAAQANEPDVDPLRDELIRCQSIGQAGASDAACLRAWAENRRRFLVPGALVPGARQKARLAQPDDATAMRTASVPDEIGKPIDPLAEGSH